MTEDRFRQIIAKLLERSKRNEVRWRERRTLGRSDIRSYGVQISPEVTIVSLSCSPSSSADWASAYLELRHEKVVTLLAEDTEPDYKLLNSLNQEARRIATGLDGIMADIEKALDSDETIGEKLE